MSEEKLPQQVAEYVGGQIDSVLQLELILLLHREPERRWTAAEIDGVLRINRQWVAGQLAELCRRGILRCNEGVPTTYQFGPASAEMLAAIDGLATWYGTHRVLIISMIYSKPTDNLRTFADAFRLRKEKPNG